MLRIHHPNCPHCGRETEHIVDGGAANAVWEIVFCADCQQDYRLVIYDNVIKGMLARTKEAQNGN